MSRLSAHIALCVLGIGFALPCCAGEKKSDLDKYDPKNINPLEKFAWQPKELVAVFGEHRGRQGGAVTSVAYSRNGKMLVSGSNNGFVRFWDPATMRLQYRLTQPGGNFALAFNKDNTLLAGGGGDGNVILWDITVDPPKQQETFKVSSTPVYSLAIAPSGKTLAVGTGDSQVSLWDLTQTPPRQTATGDTHKGIVHGVAFAPDGKTLASGAADKTLRLWTILNDNKLKEKAVTEAHPGSVLAVAYHPTDEKLLVTGCGDGTIAIWNVGGPKLVPKAFKSAGGAVHAVAVSLSGKTLATAHGDGTCRTWTVGTTVQERSLLEGHINAAVAIAFAPDGATLVSGSQDWTVRQWSTASAPKLRDKTIASGHLSHVYSLNFAPEGQTLASGSYDRTVRFWDLAATPAKEKLPHVKADNYLLGVTFAPDGKSLAARGAGVSFRTYDAATHRLQFAFKGHTGQISGLTYARDGSLILTSGHDKSIRLWDPKTGKPLESITSFEAPVLSAGLSPDNRYVLAAGGSALLDNKGQRIVKNGAALYQNSMVRIFELANKQEIFRWKSDKLQPNFVSFTADGKQFFVGASDAWLRTWSWPEPLPTDPTILYKGASSANQISFSADGRLIAVQADGGYAVLERATGKRLCLWLFQENLGHIAFAPDNRHLAIALATGVIYLVRLEEK